MKRNYIKEVNETLLESLNEDILPGGQADGKPDSDFNSEELKLGVNHELEHIDAEEISKSKNIDIEKAKKFALDMASEIAKDHLIENPKYYSELEDKEGEEDGE